MLLVRGCKLHLGAWLMLLVWCSPALATPDPFGDLRALWISRFDYSPYSASNINTIIDNAASMGFTDILWQVRGRADAFYDGSIYEPKATAVGSLDALQVALDRAHSHGMKLHAWTNAMPLWNLAAAPSTSTVQDPSLHPFNAVPNPTAANPGFRVIDNFGNPEPGNSFTGNTYAMFNPASPATHDHVNSVLRDIATRYNVDGIHLDYIRYGVNQSVSGETPFNRLPHDDATHQMYTAWAQQQYPGEPGRWDGSNFTNATDYRQFIRERITDLVGSLKGMIDAVELETGRNIALSAAVWRNPNIGSADYMQDYRTWLERDYLDIAMPMMYLSSSNDYLMTTDLAAVMSIQTNAQIAPGLGVYMHTSSGGGVELTITQLQRLYDWGADGATFYHYPSFFSSSDSLAPQRRTAVTNWYNNLPPVEEPGPGNVIDDFEVDEGHFGWAYDTSPISQTFGLAASTTIDRVTTEHQGTGIGSQLLNLVSDGSASWQIRHDSGIGTPAAPASNVALVSTGYIGFWLKTDDPGVSVQIALDDPGTADRGFAQNIIADNQWHLYQWNLEDDRQWDGWVTGDGSITGATVTIDSIFFNGTGNVQIFMDNVSHNPAGLLAAAPLPGDYNGNGVVDAADYDAWRATFGQAVTAGTGADGNGNGQIDAADYVVWRSEMTAGAGSAVGATAVPEPASVLLLVAAALALVAFRPNCSSLAG